MTVSKQISRVAVIGAGPSGLAATKYGCYMGKWVTISTDSSLDTSLLRDTLTRSMSLRKEAALEACGITLLAH